MVVVNSVQIIRCCYRTPLGTANGGACHNKRRIVTLNLCCARANKKNDKDIFSNREWCFMRGGMQSVCVCVLATRTCTANPICVRNRNGVVRVPPPPHWLCHTARGRDRLFLCTHQPFSSIIGSPQAAKLILQCWKFQTCISQFKSTFFFPILMHIQQNGSRWIIQKPNYTAGNSSPL